MALINFENYPSTDTAINAANLNNNFSEILNLIYPIGRGFIDFTNTDYSNYLGFTWERELVGLTPIGLDTTQEEFDTIGKTGGEKTHTLTVNEMPKHKHEFTGYPYYGGTISWGDVAEAIPYFYPPNDSATYQRKEALQNSGGGQPHNNLQPYQVVAYWKRIA